MNFQFSIFNFSENQKYWTKQISSGFTFIEMVILVSVILILTAITVPIYQGSRNQIALQGAANKLAQDIRKAEQMAMSAKEISGVVPPRYGVEFNTGSPDYYFLFADLNDNGKREPADQVIERINFKQGISVNQLFVNDPPVSKTKIWITFSPPDPITAIRDPSSIGSSIGRIQLIGGGQTKTIIVNNAGLIYIE